LIESCLVINRLPTFQFVNVVSGPCTTIRSRH